MSRRRSSFLRSALALVLLVALSACDRGLDYGGGVDRSAAEIQAPGPQQPKRKRPAAKRDDDATKPGRMTFVIVDQDGARRSGVPVRISGPSRTTVLSGARGRAVVSLAPGRYEVEVPAGCHERVEIFEGAGGTLGIAPGKAPKPVTFRIEMRRRYFPSGPITWSPEPPWPSGERARFGFSIFDRCTDAPAPNVSFADLTYRAANLDLLDPPSRSGAGGVVSLAFRCEQPGNATLFLEDAENPKDGTDLLTIRAPSFGPTDWCG